MDTNKYAVIHLDKLAEIAALAEESNDMLLSCVHQFLMTDDNGIITHSYMSTEERLCALLVKRGFLESVGPGKFKVVKK